MEVLRSIPTPVLVVQVFVGTLLLISLVSVFSKAQTIKHDPDACEESHQAAEFIANWSAGGMALGGVAVSFYGILLVGRTLS